MNSAGGVIYSGLEWITRFAYVNLLWILFTLAGGIILGFFPATTALFALNREWLRGNSDLPVFKSFWQFYKKDFWKSNLFGLFIGGTLIIIFTDIWYMRINAGNLPSFIYLPFLVFIVLFLLLLFYVFPAFAHYDLKVTQVIKNAFLIMLVSPLHSFLMAICLISVFFVMRALPGLAFIFGASIYAFITMWLSYHAFNRAENKQNKTTN